jgi:hypothetical protein
MAFPAFRNRIASGTTEVLSHGRLYADYFSCALFIFINNSQSLSFQIFIGCLEYQKGNPVEFMDIVHYTGLPVFLFAMAGCDEV